MPVRCGSFASTPPSGPVFAVAAAPTLPVMLAIPASSAHGVETLHVGTMLLIAGALRHEI